MRYIIPPYQGPQPGGQAIVEERPVFVRNPLISKTLRKMVPRSGRKTGSTNRVFLYVHRYLYSTDDAERLNCVFFLYYPTFIVDTSVGRSLEPGHRHGEISLPGRPGSWSQFAKVQPLARVYGAARRRILLRFFATGCCRRAPRALHALVKAVSCRVFCGRRALGASRHEPAKCRFYKSKTRTDTALALSRARLAVRRPRRRSCSAVASDWPSNGRFPARMRADGHLRSLARGCDSLPPLLHALPILLGCKPMARNAKFQQ